MRLSDATPADAAWLAPAAARMFRAAFEDQNAPDDMAAYVAEAFAVEQVTRELADPATTTLLAHDVVDGDERFVGYASLVVGTTDDVPGERPVELRRLYVEGPGRGDGAVLLRAALVRAAGDGHDTIWLGVWEHNHGARRFYATHGFRPVGTHTFMLGSDPQTDMVLARPL